MRPVGYFFVITLYGLVMLEFWPWAMARPSHILSYVGFFTYTVLAIIFGEISGGEDDEPLIVALLCSLGIIIYFVFTSGA